MTQKMHSAIERITLNTPTYNNVEIKPTYINFFYGRNGTGKSTIASAIEANTAITWQNNGSASEYDVLVYNQEFIERNFENYGDLQGVFTVCEANIEVEKLRAKKLEEKSEFDSQSKTNTDAAENKKKEKDAGFLSFQELCWSKTKDIQSNFKESMTGFLRKIPLANNVLATATAVQHDLTELKRMYDVAFNNSARTYTEFSRAGSSTTYGKLPGRALMDKIIVSSSDTPFAKFMKALNSSDWVRTGYAQFKQTQGNKCPYCQQALPTTFEEDIASCFDAQYQQDIDDIGEFNFTYVSETTAVVRALQANLNDVMPTIDEDLLSDYASKLELLESRIEINCQRISGKVKEPTSVVSLEDTDSLLIEIGNIIDKINKQIKANNAVVSDQKKQKKICTAQVWEHIAFILKEDVKAYNKGQADLQKEIEDFLAKAKSTKAESRRLTLEISELNSKVVNTELAITGINNFLHDSGFQGFWLRGKQGVPNTYEVIRGDGTVAEKLSEGERNFIAFLYFYHLVRGSHSSDEVKDKIVVIDDPVSSMDSGSLFIVSAIVREMIEVCYNNTDYRGQTVAGDYIKQLFVLTHNVYFHREITYNQVARYRSVNFYLIRKSDNNSTIKLCDRCNERVPTERENYNPVQNSYASLWDEFKALNSPIPVLNVIRQILEYYFMQLCGYDGSNIRSEVLDKNRDKFITEVEDDNPNMEKYHLASAMLTYISNTTSVSDGLNYVEDYDDVNLYKTVFKLIFEALNQEQHYNMMMGTAQPSSVSE